MLRMFPVNLCSLCGFARVGLRISQRHLSRYILETRSSQQLRRSLKFEDCFIRPQQITLLRAFHQSDASSKSNKYSTGRPRVTSFSLAETADDKRKQRGGLGSMVKIHNPERGKSIKLKHFEKVSQFESGLIEQEEQDKKLTKKPSTNECVFMVDFLPSNITVELLQQHFQEFGALSDVFITLNVDRDDTYSRSFAFIVFNGDHSPIPNVQGKHEIAGSPGCIVNTCRKSVKAMRRSKKKMKCYLENLSPSTHEERIEEWFSAYARVKSVRILRGNQSDSSQTAVIQFVTAAEAAKVSDIGTFQVHDRTLTVRRLGATVRLKPDRDDSENQEEADTTDCLIPEQ